MYYMRLCNAEYSQNPRVHTTLIFVIGNPEYTCCTHIFKPTFTGQIDDLFSKCFKTWNWEFSSENWEKKILFGIGNITE